jgi:hypothetical protein
MSERQHVAQIGPAVGQAEVVVHAPIHQKVECAADMPQVGQVVFDPVDRHACRRAALPAQGDGGGGVVRASDVEAVLGETDGVAGRTAAEVNGLAGPDAAALDGFHQFPARPQISRR